MLIILGYVFTEANDVGEFNVKAGDGVQTLIYFYIFCTNTDHDTSNYYECCCQY